MSPRGAGGVAWVRLVFLLPVLMSCVRSCFPAGCTLLSPCSVRSLCYPKSVSARMGDGPSQVVLGRIIVNH